MSEPATDRDRLLVSFIVPARNEEANIPRTLRSVVAAIGESTPCELIVVDNGSVDATANLAEAAGAVVLKVVGRTIGGLRNIGADRARGEILAFLDADVSLTSSWRHAFPRVVEMLDRAPRTITGARCAAPEDANWIGRTWFVSDDRDHEVDHVGAGHLITSAKLFAELGGFDERLETGEDYDLCARARTLGAKVASFGDLRAIHHGTPRRMIDFVRREAWHGRADAVSWRAFLHSRSALLAVAFGAGHVALLALAALGPVWPPLWLLPAAAIVVLCLMSIRARTRRTSIAGGMLFYLYFTGRLLALLHVAPRRHRSS